jgi:hypothetical protein
MSKMSPMGLPFPTSTDGLPDGLTAGKHTTNTGDCQKDEGDKANDDPPQKRCKLPRDDYGFCLLAFRVTQDRLQ